MAELEELSWDDIIPVINDSIGRVGLFLDQFKNREIENISQREFEDFLGHLEDAERELEEWREKYYYEGTSVKEVEKP